MRHLLFVLGAALCWLSSPVVATAESWILWESLEEGRLHPVDSPFPSQAACVSRGGQRTAQFGKQYKSKYPDAVTNFTDDRLTLSIRRTLSIRPPAETLNKPDRREKLAADEAKAIAKYRATLEPVLEIYERELVRQTELAQDRQNRFERGALSASELERGQRALDAAQKDVDDTRRSMAEADRMATEARSAEADRKAAGVSRPPTTTTRRVEFTALRYQCWPVGVNPQ